MTDRSDVVEKIVGVARDADEPQQLTSGAVEKGLLDDAVQLFGSWEQALAAGLVDAVSNAKRRSSTSRQAPATADVERRVTGAFEHPIYVETTDDKFFALPGPTLEVGTGPQTPGARENVSIRRLHYVGDSEALFLFSDQGRYFGLDARMVPNWSQRDSQRSIRDVLFLSQGESIQAAVARKRMVSGRVIHVTRGAKAKATDAAEFGRELDRSGRQGFKVREGDRPVGVMGVGSDTTVFCASATGRGIHFEDSELRSMGRNAIGVNAMKLEGDDDRVVAAFEGRRVQQLAVITGDGLGKRVDFSEFRTQGRNGKGMQLARLNPGDFIAGVVACNPAKDVAVTTDRGRVFRLRAGDFYMMGRSAKGNQMVELDDAESIIDMEALPCGGE